MCLAFGMTFEVPVVVVVLVRMGLVTVEKLKSIRPYVIVGAFVVAAIVTPPDIASQLFLAIPMCLLFEIGLLVAPLFAKATRAPEETA
jgi:sec-independent protein translocase protein TatC